MDEDEDAEDATEVQLLRDAMVDARRCRQRCVCGLTGTDSIPACSSGWPCTVRGGHQGPGRERGDLGHGR